MWVWHAIASCRCSVCVQHLHFCCAKIARRMFYLRWPSTLCFFCFAGQWLLLCWNMKFFASWNRVGSKFRTIFTHWLVIIPIYLWLLLRHSPCEALVNCWLLSVHFKCDGLVYQSKLVCANQHNCVTRPCICGSMHSLILHYMWASCSGIEEDWILV